MAAPVDTPPDDAQDTQILDRPLDLAQLDPPRRAPAGAGGAGGDGGLSGRGPHPAAPTGAGTPPRRWRPSRLQLALLVSLVLHAGLLAFRFIDPERFERVFRDTPLDVVLVNARSADAPVQAQAIAQANLNGGSDAPSGRATSPLPASPTEARGDSAEDTRRRIQEMQEQQQHLLAMIRREIAKLPPPDPQRDEGSAEQREQEERRRQLLKQLAEIEKRINDENARPRRRYISPATREAAYALYYDSLRRRIEDRGTRNFPEHGGQKLYGELTMNITVDAQGKVVEADVVQPSGSRILDRRAVAIVRAAAPFGGFTHEMRRQADQIVVTSRFRFTRDDELETSLSNGRN